MIFFLSGTATILSQPATWQFGIEAGAGFRSLKIDPPYPSLDTRAGFSYTGGMSIQYNIDDTWAIKIGAAYEKKGTDFDRTDIQTDGHVDLNYIAIPLLFRSKFGKGIKYFTNVGPYLGIFLSNRTTINAYSGNPSVEINNDSSTKSIDFGLSLGFGLEIPVSSTGAITLEIRDNLGLTNISRSKESDAPELKTNTANLMVGYVLVFGGSTKRIRR